MRKLILPLACAIGGAVFAHSLDAPHIVKPAEFRVLAETIQDAIKITAYSVRHQAEINGETRPVLASTLPVIAMGSENVLIGNCSGYLSLTTQSRALLLGNRTAAPPKGNGFVNIANKLCFWRDTGERVACPAPEPECEGK